MKEMASLLWSLLASRTASEVLVVVFEGDGVVAVVFVGFEDGGFGGSAEGRRAAGEHSDLTVPAQLGVKKSFR